VNKHPLADYVRILARGKNASRNMTAEEAEFTMSHFLSGDYAPEQLGAVLMLLRVLEETPDEIAGFARAINPCWPEGAQNFDLVWSSYAGKRRQPMWWMLSALLLTQMGYRILVHGTLAHTEGRVYSHEVFNALGLPAVTRESLAATTDALVYLPCAEIHSSLQQWLGLKAILGVRSPVNTILKTIAPEGVPAVQGIFHPNYKNIHLGAAELNQDDAMVIKGEGGEFEVNPERRCVASFRFHDASGDIEILNEASHYAEKPETPDPQLLKQFWQGDYSSDYGQAAVLNTAALALCTIRRSSDLDSALSDCRAAWDRRDISLLS
tara:strand:+ start:1156 stop:2124 length:969 start_codon:yes stop_codon:yes gene_type:complete